MTVLRHDDVEDFLTRARPYLLLDEPRHNLEFGICTQLRSDPLLYGEPAYLATVEHDGRVLGVVMRTPPHNLLVSLADPSDLRAVAADVRDRFASLRGVMSTPETALGFAAAWKELGGRAAEEAMRQRIYRLDEVPAVPPAPGRYRDADAHDRALLVRWVGAFADEALPPDVPHRVEESVDARLQAAADGGFAIWEDGDPVSVAGYGGPTPTGIRIGPVYTPPELRGRGYASACVARLSARLLEGGRRTCFLFTDLSNPTSNGVYTRIGYRPVRDMLELRFIEPDDNGSSRSRSRGDARR